MIANKNEKPRPDWLVKFISTTGMTHFQDFLRHPNSTNGSLNLNGASRQSSKLAATGFILALVIGTAPVRLQAQSETESLHARKESAPRSQPAQVQLKTHHFFDRTNLMLFAGVAAIRALDFTSTQHFRSLGHNEVLLTNSVVDNKPLFAGIEVAGTALSIGISYWLHRTGHHKLERWVSIVHIGVGAFGDIHNYSLAAPSAPP